MDTSTPAGTWYLLANASRLELSIQFQNNTYSGTIRNEGGAAEPLDQIVWDPVGRSLEFRRHGAAFFQWYRICITYGVMAGRFYQAAAPAKPALTAYSYHVTGWSPAWLDSDIVPRTWTLTINQTYTAVLRIDRDAGRVLRPAPQSVRQHGHRRPPGGVRERSHVDHLGRDQSLVHPECRVHPSVQGDGERAISPRDVHA